MNKGRTLALIIFLYLTAISSIGQILNAEGLKMVKKIEIAYHPIRSGGNDDYLRFINVDLGYDANDRLVSLTINETNNVDDYNGKKAYRFVNGKLTRNDYKNGKQSPFEWFEYDFKDGLIRKMSSFCRDSDGGNGCLRHDTELVYGNEINGFPRLSQTINKWYVRMRGGKIFEKGDSLAYDGHNFRLEDGNLMPRQYWVSFRGNWLDDNAKIERVYSDRVNDTNINWDYLLTQHNEMCLGELGCWEMMTEWAAMQSSHLMDVLHRSEYSRYILQYSFDNNDNLKGIKIFYYQNITKEKITMLFDVKIEYVY